MNSPRGDSTAPVDRGMIAEKPQKVSYICLQLYAPARRPTPVIHDLSHAGLMQIAAGIPTQPIATLVLDRSHNYSNVKRRIME